MINRFDGTKYRFLSNFYLAEVEYEGLKYPSTEHAYQAAKTLNKQMRVLFTDKTLTPGRAKGVGKKLDLRSDWESVKIGVMETLVREKFTKHPKLLQRLLETGDELLVEGNTWGDKFWGQVNGEGENWLGKTL